MSKNKSAFPEISVSVKRMRVTRVMALASASSHYPERKTQRNENDVSDAKYEL